MLLQFTVVSDGSLWIIDSDDLRYRRVDAGKWEACEIVTEELGKLKLVNPLLEVYRLDGRDAGTEGPGAGITSIAILSRVLKTGTIVSVSANVEIKNPVCILPQGVECEVIGREKGLVN